VQTSEPPSSHADSSPSPLPALWHDAAPHHFDLAFPWWAKFLLLVAATLISIQWLDYPIAHWTLLTHPIPDLADANAKQGDAARELMFLEQWGQWTCSVLVILAVALIDKAGRRRALAIAIGCLVTVLITYLLKDMFGRSRPHVLDNGNWIWGGPAKGFHNGSAWGSFPSAHTTGAFALSVGLSWYYPRARGLFMSLAVITAAQRILHSFHYLSDTFAGIAMSVLITRTTLQHQFAARLVARFPKSVQAWFAPPARLP
jgi:membrane-associated phospholipid phosphatase